jgi:hypothetical protein
MSVFDANKIEARCRVEASFDCRDNRFKRWPWKGASSRTKTSGGRIDTSSGRMRPNSTPTYAGPSTFPVNGISG